VKIANNETPNETIKVKLNNSNLYSSFIELSKEIEQIKVESKVNLAFILKYTNFFLRMILVNTNLSKGIYQEYLDRLNHYFQSDSFSEELNNFSTKKTFTILIQLKDLPTVFSICFQKFPAYWKMKI
jgi:hypothetical protein